MLSAKIGRKIRSLRAEKTWNQTALAERFDPPRSQSAIARMEAGASIDVDTLEEVAAIFGMSAEELIRRAREIQIEEGAA